MGHAGFSRRVTIAAIAAAGSLSMSGNLPPSTWDPSDITFTQGTAANIPLTAPVGYATGGVYQAVGVTAGIDGNGVFYQLMQGVKLYESGMVSYDGLGTPATVSMLFSYFEPGGMPTLTLYTNAVGGDLPWMAGVYPLEGVVPAGKVVVSPDDASLRSSTINTWPDGSARVVALYGVKNIAAGGTATVRLRPGNPSGTNLTDARIAQTITSITADFGELPQTLNFASATKDKTWWANPRAICNRYRLSLNKGVMEAVIDVHAFADVGGTSYAFVEVVVENSRFNSASATPTPPTDQTYTNATIAINGTVVLTVNPPLPTPWPSSQPPNPIIYASGQHKALRAFYFAAWVKNGVPTALRGASDPFVEVTHDTLYLQSHPLLHGKHARADTNNYATALVDNLPYGTASGDLNGRPLLPYSNDLYKPWDYGRNYGYNMGSPGNIGPLSNRGVRYSASGHRFLRRAVIADGLVQLSWGINYRDSTTNEVPTYTQLGSKFTTTSGGTWPAMFEEPVWESAHQPCGPILAFLCQPSPCFIELNQKICLWNSTRTSESPTPQQSVQLRGMAWNLRALSHSLFMTPVGAAWNVPAENIFHQTLMLMDAYRTSGKFPLRAFWQYTPDKNLDPRSYAPGYQFAMWNQVYLVSETYKAHISKIISDPAKAAALQTFVEWQLQLGVKWVNEQPNGGWRYHAQYICCGAQNYTTPPDPSSDGFPWGTDPLQFSSWADMQTFFYTDSPPSVTGTWMNSDNTGSASSQSTPGIFGSYLDPANFYAVNVANSPFGPYTNGDWPALVHAAEMDVPGAAQAWQTVHDGITNLTTWLNGFAADPRYGLWPRNKPLDK